VTICVSLGLAECGLVITVGLKVRVRVWVRVRVRVANCCIQTAGEGDKMRIKTDQ